MATAATTRAATLIGSSIVWDNHSCMPLRADDPDFLPQLARARAAGFSTVSLNIGFGEQTPEEHLRVLGGFRRWLKARPDEYQIIERPGDVAAARAAGKMGIIFDIEGARGVGDALGLVELYYDLGVRWMLIAYNRDNLAGSGCYEDDDGGLTPFGHRMIAEMQRVGMAVCCSHTGERTTRDVLAAATRPVIFSHSNCAAVHPHRRNISDAMIRACAAQGGVIGINGIGDFLCPPGGDIVEAFVRHVDHAVQLVGPQHVGLGIDYVYDQQELIDYLETLTHSFPDGVPSVLSMVEPEELGAIVEGLVTRGYDDDAIRMVLGGSWLRAAEACWRG